MTRDEFLATVRRELQDGGANFVWSEAQLLDFLDESLQRLSRDVPPVIEQVVAGAANQRDFGVAGMWSVTAVEFPSGSGNFIPAQGWQLLPQPTQNVLRLAAPLSRAGLLGVRGYGFYEMPPSGDSELNLAPENYPLLRWLLCGRAVGWLAQQRAKRGDPAQVYSPAYYEGLYRVWLRSHRPLRSATLQLAEF